MGKAGDHVGQEGHYHLPRQDLWNSSGILQCTVMTGRRGPATQTPGWATAVAHTAKQPVCHPGPRFQFVRAVANVLNGSRCPSGKMLISFLSYMSPALPMTMLMLVLWMASGRLLCILHSASHLTTLGNVKQKKSRWTYPAVNAPM